MKTIAIIPLTALFVTSGLVGCLPYRINTVTFQLTAPNPLENQLQPKTSIDTNISITGPFGGFIKSNKPYSIGINHSDLSFTIAAIEFTKVVVTYEDGSTDPGSIALKLPLRFDSRHHVLINSGGPPPKYTFETPMRLISEKIPDVISRDEPLTILIEGRFIKDNGTTIPFKIHESYKPEIEKGTKSWIDVISEV